MINREQFNSAFALIEELDQLQNLIAQPEKLVAPLLPESVERDVLQATLVVVKGRVDDIKQQLKGFSIHA